MPTLKEKIAFAERYVTNKEGARFSLAGRSWVRDRFWLPADGFKLWPRADSDPENLCESCRDAIGAVVDHPDDNNTRACPCGGLAAEPIIVTILNLQRQAGKTFNTMAYALATLFKARNKSIAFVAASEDQAEALFRENYEATIKRSKKLSQMCELRRLRIDGTASPEASF